MIQGKWFPPGADIAPVIPVRQSVFSRGTDELDAISWNTLIWEDDIPVATGRIWYRDGSYHIGDIGVLSCARGRRLGDLTLRLLLFKAQSHAAHEVRLCCAPDTSDFFTRLGFRAVSETPEETEMLIPGDRIELDSCKNCPRSDCSDRH